MARLSRLILYIDGIDELSDIYMEQFDNFFVNVKFTVRKVIPRFSCRTEFANKHLSRYVFEHKFHVEKWNRSQLQDMAELILKNLKGYDQQKIKNIEAYIKSREIPWDFIDSPLLLKLLIYIKLHSNQDFKLITNKYLFYSIFFQTIITIYQKEQKKAPNSIEDIVGEAAEAVFRAYTNHEKSIPYMQCLTPLIKERYHSEISYVCLAHETFYEYLTAYYYHSQILRQKISKTSIKVMASPYSNDYADFITDAFAGDTEESQKSAIQTMARLYGYTLSQHIADSYTRQFIPDYEYNDEILS